MDDEENDPSSSQKGERQELGLNSEGVDEDQSQARLLEAASTAVLPEQQQQQQVPRLRASRSAPSLTRAPSRLESFVAGLVSDVEEYVGRGGYELSPDDRDDEGGGDPVTDEFDRGIPQIGYDQDGAPVDLGRHPADTSSVSSGWGWFGLSRRNGRGERMGWFSASEEEGAGHEPFLSGATRRFTDGGPMPSDRPQEFVLRRARSSSAAQYGGNTVARTVITFLKGMLGSYVLYLPRMFAQGGMVFSTVVLVLLAVASTYNMLLLLRCRESLAGRGISACSYGEVGRAALGRAGWISVDISLFLSQLGYCVVYLIFVEQNLGPMLRKAFSPHPPWLFGTFAIMLLQACIQVPLSWVRRLKYLGAGMLVANVCVFGGLLVILVEVSDRLASVGTAGENSGDRIVLINPAHCLILLGSVVGCFEGIGLVLPIQDAMDLRVRDRLPAALCWSMAGITAFFFAFGTAGYLAYGNDVANFITMDLPQKTLVGTVIRVMYSVGLILTSPLQLFPAVKVLERLLWPDTGAKKPMPDRRRKWLKNLLRASTVAFTVVVALVAGGRFDSFVGLVGGVCATPLALVYPPLFHISLFGKLDTPRQAYLHRFLLFMGIFAGVSSTVVAIAALA